MRCETAGFYDEIRKLLENIAYERPIDQFGAAKLKLLLDRWDTIDCPEGGCRAEMCEFARPLNWVEFHGYQSLYELIEDLDQNKPISSIPVKPGFEITRATWARRLGHFNP